MRRRLFAISRLYRHDHEPSEGELARDDVLVHAAVLEVRLGMGRVADGALGWCPMTAADPVDATGSADPVECFRAICARVGFDLASAQVSIIERTRLLAEYSETVADAMRMAEHAHEVFRHYERSKPGKRFSAVEQRTVVLGCLFSDLGKAGPASAAPDAMRLIVEMFSVEGVSDDQQSVAAFFEAYFPDDQADRSARFRALDLDPGMTMRQFWNLHSGWTLAVAETAGLPMEAVAAAASHHLLDDVNPQAIVGDDQRFTRAFGENTAFDRAEKLVIVLDKYDAIRRRSHRTHEQAIVWLRARVAQNARFRDDADLATLITDLDVVMAEHEVALGPSALEQRVRAARVRGVDGAEMRAQRGAQHSGVHPAQDLDDEGALLASATTTGRRRG